MHPDAAALAAATAARLLVRLLDLQSVRSPLHLVVTGGTVGIATLRAVAASPVRDAVDWTGVHVWWGDERFVPADSPDRNERQAREALLDALPIPAENVHAMLPEGAASDEDASAAAYAAELAQFAPAAEVTGDATGKPAVPECGIGAKHDLESLRRSNWRFRPNSLLERNLLWRKCTVRDNSVAQSLLPKRIKS